MGTTSKQPRTKNISTEMASKCSGTQESSPASANVCGDRTAYYTKGKEGVRIHLTQVISLLRQKVTILMNSPSTADDSKDDKTVIQVRNILIRDNRFGKFNLVNCNVAGCKPDEWVSIIDRKLPMILALGSKDYNYNTPGKVREFVIKLRRLGITNHLYVFSDKNKDKHKDKKYTPCPLPTRMSRSARIDRLDSVYLDIISLNRTERTQKQYLKRKERAAVAKASATAKGNSREDEIRMRRSPDLAIIDLKNEDKR